MEMFSTPARNEEKKTRFEKDAELVKEMLDYAVEQGLSRYKIVLELTDLADTMGIEQKIVRYFIKKRFGDK